MRWIAAMLLAGLFIGMGGCGSAPRDRTTFDDVTLAEGGAAADTIPAAFVYPLEGERHYRVVGSDAVLVRSVEETDRFDAAWVLDEDDVRREYLARDDDGRLVLTATIDEAEKTITRFTPPLTVCWPKLERGESYTAEAKMEVFELGRRHRLKEKGTAHREMFYSGPWRTTNKDGRTWTTYRVEITFRADLRMASVLRRDVLWVTEDGPFVIDTYQDVTVLGVLPSVMERSLTRETTN